MEEPVVVIMSACDLEFTIDFVIIIFFLKIQLGKLKPQPIHKPTLKQPKYKYRYRTIVDEEHSLCI